VAREIKGTTIAGGDFRALRLLCRVTDNAESKGIISQKSEESPFFFIFNAA
jgi:hypothetical protein